MREYCPIAEHWKWVLFSQMAWYTLDTVSDFSFSGISFLAIRTWILQNSYKSKNISGFMLLTVTDHGKSLKHWGSCWVIRKKGFIWFEGISTVLQHNMQTLHKKLERMFWLFECVQSVTYVLIINESIFQVRFFCW